MINLIKSKEDIDTFADLFINSLPDGFLYNGDNTRNLCKGFLEVYQDFYKTIQQAVNDIFDITETNLYLEEYKVMYGLPNVLFPTINTNEEAVFAISMMKLSQQLLSKEDFESFMLLLGYNVTFYKLNNSTLDNSGFDYGFPISFSYGVSGKDKYTYWIYVQEGESADPTTFNNLGDAFDLDFVESENNRLKVKKILDYLKPDYLIFQYISLYTKNLYGL